uniref:Translation elongation factor EF1B beta/delta subunit guanine nucleotide exchange domain-containing protein n=1 Tax=Mandrillus leucophaeus TaxID=9568 RepID=A0A2K5XQD3_MANLE
MDFGDLKSPAGLQVLNNYLVDKSYIEGYLLPPADLCHALRWYNHIKSYEKEKASLPGLKKALGKYGPVDVEDTIGRGEKSEEAKRLREECLAQHESKKAKKPALIKSSILLDVKPWDEKTVMAKLEECIRGIQADGLVWGSCELVQVGYGIKKLQIRCVVEDKVGTDMLEKQITAFEDYVHAVHGCGCFQQNLKSILDHVI